MRERETGEGATRRGVLGGAAAGAATLLLPDREAFAAERRRARPRARHRKKEADVVVIGAGISGLTAAWRLVQAGVRSVVVLEAKPRVGGRTENQSLADGDKVVEAGGQWIGPTQTAIQRLAKELSLETFKTYNDGKTVWKYDGQRSTYSGSIPPVTAVGIADFAQAQTRLEEMAKAVVLAAPHETPGARNLDAENFETWIRANAPSPEARFVLTLLINATLGVTPSEVSLLFVLFFIKTSGGINQLLDTAGGAQDSRFVGGSQIVSLKLAERLGRRVVLDSPVTEIDQDAKAHVVVRSRRMDVSARRAIVAMAPADARRIDFRPVLPVQRVMLQKNWPTGTAFKLHAIYDTPFWREEGLNGQAFGDDDPIQVVFDNSPPDGSPGVLMGFIYPIDNRQAMLDDPVARREATLRSFARYFGDKALKPSGWLEKDWQREPYTSGCEGPLSPGILTQYGHALVAPVGRVHWAGTETSEVWCDYMDGAVRSGERAADEVQARL